MRKLAIIPLLLIAGLTNFESVFWIEDREPAEIFKEENVAVPMRDAVILRADIWRPSSEGKFPVLVYRTPYDKRRSPENYATYRKAVERGYVVVMQDVRGRYASDGEFLPYQQEGKDGYDTIEWAAKQPWSNGDVGTFGLSYPGAVQWLAAMERPPHLKAMVPAMTFSTPRNFIYSGGVFDGSWVAWIWNNVAPDVRVKKNLPGPKTGAEARAAFEKDGKTLQGRLPLMALDELKNISPWYFEWMRHEPQDAWWEWCELRGKYDRTDAAVLNLSGWYDEAYGPEGATTNFSGVVAARKGQSDKRARLLIGPWVHGVGATKETKAGERDFGPQSAIDYDEIVLRWMDRYVKGIDNGVEREKPVRVFVMGGNTWREADAWPIPGTQLKPLYLSSTASAGKPGNLSWTVPQKDSPASSFVSDPANPLTDPYPAYSGGHNYSAMAQRRDVLIFETAPLAQDTEVTGNITVEIYISCDAPDTDLWVKLLDVAPSGRAVNLMSPGLDVQRASYRNEKGPRELLQPGRVYKLTLKNLITSNVFLKGHRIRAQISAAFFPHFSRNLHTGKLEMTSADTRKATITIQHDKKYPSRITLPVLPR